MRAYRFLGGSLLAAAFLSACSETQPTIPPDSALAAAGAPCQVIDNQRAQVRQVTGSCGNDAVSVPSGWTLQTSAGAASNEVIATNLTPIENPDASYVEGTNLIDISEFSDFTVLSQITDGDQTVSFNPNVEKRSVPGSWATWGSPPFTEGSTPHILFTQGSSTLEMTLSLPSSVFGFELNPNPFDVITYTADFYSGAELVGSVTRAISGDAGARLLAAQTDGPAFTRVVVSGGADFSIARVRYAEGAINGPIDVEIDAVFSGPPNRDPNEISLNDPTVFVQILDIEQYLGRPASAGDVRIGDDWETGTPAEGFTILDLNGDGNRDIQVRFATEDLIDDGHLGPNTTEITVWGRDDTTGDLYRGTAEVEIIDGPGDPVVLWDNGPVVTHPGAGPGGADVSMADPIFNTAGSNVLLIGAGPEFRIADNFLVTGGGWTVNQVVTHAYQTGGSPAWTGFNANLWDGEPGQAGSSILGTVTSASIAFTGIYRTFNGVLNNADRPIYAITWDLGGVNLPDGEYWIDWQVEGGASAWAPYVTLPDPQGGNNTETVFENGRQRTALGWQPILAEPGAETPFLVVGVPQVSTPAMQPYRPRDGGRPAVGGPQLRLPADHSTRAVDTPR